VLEDPAPLIQEHLSTSPPPYDPAALPRFEVADDQPVRTLVLQALAAHGLQPRIDEDGDVGVVLAGQMLFVRCVDAQPPLARVFGQWVLETAGADELTWLRAANAVTGALNLVKATVHGDRLVIAIDLVIADTHGLGALLTSALDAVLTAVHTWHETVNQLRPNGGGGPHEVLAPRDAGTPRRGRSRG
jgi:hypothetical protein